MEIITSKANNLVKKAKKLRQKKYRTQSYLIEGWHLFEEAVAAGVVVQHIFVLAEFADRVVDFPQAVQVSSDILKDLTDSPSPQGIAAVLELPPLVLPERLEGRFLLLEDIQDPGNVGSLIRTADAAGFDGVFISDKTADIYNLKTLRSMQGSHFHLPVYRLPILEALDRLSASQVEILAAVLSEQSSDYRTVKPTGHFALVLGNEGQGLSPTVVQRADKLIHISMPGQAESLNVAVAAGIIAFNLI